MARTKGVLAVVGASVIQFAIGLYFSSGNTGIYLTSYLRQLNQSTATLSDSVWFLYFVGFSALLLPFGGWLDTKIGCRGVCIIGGILQSVCLFSTYIALEYNFISVLICYGGSFFFSCGICYTAPLVLINKWFPDKRGLVTGIACAAMAFAPSAWIPLITAYVNPLNIPPDMNGYFTDLQVLQRTKSSLIIQAFVSMALFALGISLLFPAPPASQLEKEKNQKNTANPSIRPDRQRFENGLSPRQAIKTREFYVFSIKIMLTELIFFYLLFVYKTFGATFIKDDLLLSLIGGFASFSNTLCRLSMGYIRDIFSHKTLCIPLSGIATILIIALPTSSLYHSRLGYFYYASCAVLSIGFIGSQYALMPCAITEAFGEKYASMNIGLVYCSTVFADVLGALGSQYLTQYLGWEGMIYATSGCAFADFIASLCLPSDPRKKLEDRLTKQYIQREIKYKQTYAVFEGKKKEG